MNSKIPVVKIGSKEADKVLKNIEKQRVARGDEVYTFVSSTLSDIQKRGDKALFEYTKKLDGVTLTAKKIRLSQEYISLQADKVTSKLKKAIRESAKRIKAYHKEQKIDTSFSLKTEEGKLSQLVRPLNRVGVYVPGGFAAYPSTVLMNVIPAQIAGVKEIVAVTPPRDGLDPAIAYVLKLLKVQEVYSIGGAQAIAALAYGTKTIKSVDKIVGPGSSFVAVAKKMVYGVVDIDSIAGPSEVCILADSSVDPTWVALDLLSQAEHGSGDETAVCVTENISFAEKIKKAVINEIEKSEVKSVFEKLPANAISIFVAKSRKESIEFVNDVASEHLQLMTKKPTEDLKKITNGSAIFVGAYTPVALGDYFVGTNHVLPTGSAARYASPLGVDSFLKRISVANITAAGLKKSQPYVSEFARHEGFIHHAISVERRSGIE